MHEPGNETPSKAEWRTRILRARAELPPEAHAREAAALAAAASSIHAETVCAYLPFGTEPGQISLVNALAARVLLPVIPDTPGPLDWAEYTGPDALVPGRLRGVLEPSGPRLGTAAVASAQVLLIPALAVDRHGTRLGRGAGYYDRTLTAAPNTARVAVVRAEEVVNRLPAEPHDVPMTAVLTPSGLIQLPTAAAAR
ncbi:5-formyltetrahydrofolate cyclo-ligase [Amycolatopsis rubida]|uniref:5-formyltetrahydrofolate cyclo-ligase n=1 Tax=Amycolatopsis rubida TaxID=112413 RepID=A0ABX0BX30_9PSEU|nr:MULTISPECIES: 5-formyltetrahydrofolate cyclo-ligase [Amycolatopsis]MYW95199.1 5-formyltetrahydrofolate cyclo-ligase [Amycolatopsis rubida]NEC60187.1 5-formyltetrahydrofolate cyclo-ligase [Amycolatopsis rubida]OAP28404.1 5-formyltetrahydrofolate cyclo-ligase family protein [Amycolatopsis sp. M39]